MTFHKDIEINWQLVMILIALVSGAIWVGSLSNQISVNTGRITKLEGIAETTVHVLATAPMEHRELGNRIDRIEKLLKP